MSERKEAMPRKNIFQSVVPPTAAEAAINEVTWERRGLLDRLVRVEEVVAPAGERPVHALSARAS